jgi:hypothetical protein
MNKLEKWILQKIFRKLMKQSCWHRLNIISIYCVLRQVAGKEFREDNYSTINFFLRECFDQANRDFAKSNRDSTKN